MMATHEVTRRGFMAQGLGIAALCSARTPAGTAYRSDDTTDQRQADGVVQLCTRLNESGEANAATLAGSRLALRILERGQVPTCSGLTRSLAKIALRLIEFGRDPDHERLGSVLLRQDATFLREKLETQLRQAGFPETLGAWSVLRSLIVAEVAWASGLAKRFWPKSPAVQAEILRLAPRNSMAAWELEKLAEVVPDLSPATIRQILYETNCARAVKLGRRTEVAKLPKQVRQVASLLAYGEQIFGGRIKLRVQHAGQQIEGLELSLSSTGKPSEAAEFLLAVRDSRPEWQELISAARFALDSRKETLAKGLREVAAAWTDDSTLRPDWQTRWVVPTLRAPWPFGGCLAHAGTRAQLLHFAELAGNGSLGGPPDWQAAEARWTQTPIITSEELQRAGSLDQPFGPDMARRGFPLAVSDWHLNYDEISLRQTLEPLLELYLQSSAVGIFRAWLAQMLLCMIANISYCTDDALGSFKYPHPAMLGGLFFDSTRWWPGVAFPVSLSVFDHLPWDEGPDRRWIDVLEKIGQNTHWTFEVPKSGVPWASRLVEIAKGFPRPGLLRILSELVPRGPDLAKSLPEVSTAGVQPPQAQATMVLIRLAQGDWDEKEAAGLARNLAKSDAVDRHLAVLASQQGPASQRFLIELLPWLPFEVWDVREQVVQALRQYAEA